MNAEDAYAQCEVITRREARNFAYGIRLLDPKRRKALSAVYAMARRIDDIGDGPGDNETKLSQLDNLRKQLFSSPPDQSDAILVALDHVGRNFPVPMEAFEELIQGCEMDCRAQRFETFDELAAYCRLVAGSIGRLSLGVFGHSGPKDVAKRLADQLGVALQLTNILRDVLEDQRDMNRIYLPRQDLKNFGIELGLSGPPEALAQVILLNAERARSYYAQGMGLLELLDWRSRACTGAMAGIYKALLTKIEAAPVDVLHHRITVPRSRKVLVAIKSLTGTTS